MTSRAKYWESESSSSESDSESEEVKIRTIKEKTKKRPNRPQIFTDDESENEGRIVKNLKDRRFDELSELIKKARNARKINDFSTLLNNFKDFLSTLNKTAKVIEKDGVPRFFIRELADLEDYIGAKWEDKDFKKKLSKQGSKSLTTLRQRLKKYFNEETKIAAELVKYRENPDASEEDEPEKQESDDLSSDEDSMSGTSEEDDDDNMDSDASGDLSGSSAEESSSESSESDSDVEIEQSDNEFARYTIEYFMKKPDKPSKATSHRDPTKRGGDKKDGGTQKVKSDDEDWEVADPGTVGKGDLKINPITGEVTIFPKDVDINAKNVVQKLAEITAMRTPKEADRQNKVIFYKKLREVAAENNVGLGLEIKIRLSTISACYDYNPKHKDYMTDDSFGTALMETKELIDVLMTNKETVIMKDSVQDDEESLTDQVNEDGKWHARGSLVNTCSKLDTEYSKLLQNSDQHSEEYRGRLANNLKIMDILNQSTEWAHLQNDKQQLCQMFLLKVKYVYYRHRSQKGAEHAEELIEKYCKYIYTHDETQRIRTQAILYNIYHLALHDKWFPARDLMLMSHLQESIHNADIGTQIIYNRTMVQLGLCAFRMGQMEDAHQALTDIQSGNRSRELLAQGFSMARERTQEQEKTERRRMQPYHTHINTELLECVYLVSAMFLEIPYMAEKEFDSRRRMISKQFHYQLRNSEKQAFVGPPDNMREHVLAAAKALKVGDFKKCINFLINPKMNQKVWNLFAETDKVKDMLQRYAKKESLRVYLFSYSQFYDNISIDWITETFDMSSSEVQSAVSKMMINGELKASWDEPSRSLVLHKTEPTRLQNLALQLASRLNQLTESNERLCESKQGSNFTAFYQSNRMRDWSRNNNQRRF